MDFGTLVYKARDKRALIRIDEHFKLLCFDPGHTTGWAFYKGLNLSNSGQIDTTSIPTAVHYVEDLFEEFRPEALVIEDYRVYEWRAKHHAGSDMLTTRVIGCIETIAVQNFIPDIVKQPAHIAKGFCTNKKLKEWGFYQTNMKHANDAIRHGAYYLIFGAIQKKDRQRLTVG